MVDLKKEIKLSDLIPKRKAPRRPAAGKPAKDTSKKAPRLKNLVGVKVGASQIAAAQVTNDGIPKLVKVAREPLEPGIVVGGEVRDIPALSGALNDFFTKHDLPRKNVRLGIGTNRVGVRTLDIEDIDDERQLANAVTFRAYEALSIPTEQAVMDYHVVSTTANGEGKLSRRVILAAAYRDPIDQFAAAFDGAGIELVAIDVEAFALLRAVAPPMSVGSDGERAAVVGLGIGHDRTTLAISDGTTCDFTRVLEWGGSRLDAAIARELGVTIEEAAEIKLGLRLDADDPSTQRAAAAVRAELTTLARELVASLQFYQAQPDSLALHEILVTGGTTRMSGLVEELERLVRARVRTADPLAAVQASNEIAGRDDLASLAVAIGLGVER